MSNVFFGMPLISQQVSRNWAEVTHLLNATLDSIAVQSDPGFAILIAGHERPSTHLDDDARLHFLAVADPLPTTPLEQGFDKQRKIRVLVEEVFRRGGGYFILMDADDLVTRQLVEFIRSDDNRRGYLIDKGFILEPTRRRVFPVDGFDRHCGSCAIFYLSPEDQTTATAFVDAIVANGHMHYGKMAAQQGRPLDLVPFPAMVYVRHHGQSLNVRGRSPWQCTQLRNALLRLARSLLQPPRLPRDLSDNFQLPTAYRRTFRPPILDVPTPAQANVRRGLNRRLLAR